MRYLVELRDVSTGRELDVLGYFVELSHAIGCAAYRAKRFPPNSLVRFDFYDVEGEHIFSSSADALASARRGGRWMS
jgi:hypothetical protein